MNLDDAILTLQSEIAVEKRSLVMKESAIALLIELAKLALRSPQVNGERLTPAAAAAEQPSPAVPPLSSLAPAPSQSDGGNSREPLHEPQAHPSGAISDRDLLVQAVRKAVEKLGGSEFNAGDVCQLLEHARVRVPGKHPRQLISGILDVLVGTGELRRTVTGRGRMPNTYLNRVASSRRLERECQRNIELIWLTGRIAPDFKTIADFRRDNGVAIRKACTRFIALCRELNLFTQAAVAIDGSKFKAVNSRDHNFTPGKIDGRVRQLKESIQRYLEALETADRTQPVEVPAKTQRLGEKITRLRERVNARTRQGTIRRGPLAPMRSSPVR